MSDEKQIDETPEFIEPELDYEEMMKEMEADEKIRSFEIPEEWDREFRGIIDESYKKGQREQMQRSLKRVAKAACVVLVGGSLLLYNPVTAQGASLWEMLQSFFGISEKNFVTFGANGEELEVSAVEQKEIIFDAESLEDVYEQMYQEMSKSIFCIAYIPEEYILTEAKYDREFQILNLKLEKEEKIIYIVQQKILNENAAGVVTDEEACEVVKNHNLGQEVLIFPSEQDRSFTFNIKNNYETLSFDGMVTLEECKEIAESIYYR